MINRAAVVVYANEPLVDWINDVDFAMDMTLDEVNEECTVFLIADEDAEQFDEWLENNFRMIFEKELEGWYTDSELWPEELTLELFNEWFSLSLHTVVEDTADTPIEEDEFEEDEFDYDDEDDEEYDFEEVE